jgi:hypothetical protein
MMAMVLVIISSYSEFDAELELELEIDNWMMPKGLTCPIMWSSVFVRLAGI